MSSDTGEVMVDVIVVGAGIAGLGAARRLSSAGLRVRVLDKARGVGGRMASRRVGDARFDHGAQFFTTRSEAFTSLIAEAVDAGVVTEWTKGFDAEPDGFPRWRGTGAMTDLCRWMASDQDVDLSATVTDLTVHPARAHLLTAPVPQSLAILSFSRLLPPPSMTHALTAVAYRPTIAVMATFSGETNLAEHGGCQLADDPAVTFISDNHAKGVSAVPALTLHLSESWSHELWDAADVEIVERVWAAASAHLGSALPIEAHVQRWRYAGPTQMWPDPFVLWGDDPIVALAGEAFAGPKVEGAYLSGLAAGEALLERLG